MTIEQIRKELQDIRYYYSRKAMFDRASDCVAKNAAVELARKYNEAIQTAPPKLYDLYISLYTDNNTQASLAEKWGIQRRAYPLSEQTAVRILSGCV